MGVKEIVLYMYVNHAGFISGTICQPLNTTRNDPSASPDVAIYAHQKARTHARTHAYTHHNGIFIHQGLFLAFVFLLLVDCPLAMHSRVNPANMWYWGLKLGKQVQGKHLNPLYYVSNPIISHSLKSKGEG